MATQTINNFNSLDFEALSAVEGGGINWDRLASGGSGTAEGVYFCAASGAPLFTIAPYALIGCGAVGGVLGYAFPH